MQLLLTFVFIKWVSKRSFLYGESAFSWLLQIYIAKPIQDFTPIFNAVMSWMSWFANPGNSKINFIITPEDTSTQLGSASTCPIDGGIKVYI
jgi:hypothetical protein